MWHFVSPKIVFGEEGTPAITEPLILGSEGYGNNVILPEEPSVQGLKDIYQNVSIKSKNKLTKFKQKPEVSKFTLGPTTRLCNFEAISLFSSRIIFSSLTL